MQDTEQYPEFAHGKVDPVEAGKQGGATGGSEEGDDEDSSGSSGKKGTTSSFLCLVSKY